MTTENFDIVYMHLSLGNAIWIHNRAEFWREWGPKLNNKWNVSGPGGGKKSQNYNISRVT